MSLLNNAVNLAFRVHAESMDRNGAPYILHPLRVMQRMRTEREQVIAILHDTVEDSDLSLDDLRREGFPEEVVAGVDALTRREGESYDEYVDRVKINPEAVRVKLGDLEDNMDLRRLPDITEQDVERLRRYHRYWKLLSRVSFHHLLRQEVRS
ncbi:MAG: GTP pyrophosphokinase [Candidatus Latescibacterota bacterium]